MQLRNDCWDNDRRTVLVNGCFDILHPGHLHLFKQARRFGDVLIVAINSDEHVRELKGDSRPIFDIDTRIELVASVKGVDAVTSFRNNHSLEALVKILRPDVLAVGDDHQDSVIVGREYAGAVKFVRRLERYSSTGAIDKLREAAAQ